MGEDGDGDGVDELHPAHHHHGEGGTPDPPPLCGNSSSTAPGMGYLDDQASRALYFVAVFVESEFVLAAAAVDEDGGWAVPCASPPAHHSGVGVIASPVVAYQATSPCPWRGPATVCLVAFKASPLLPRWWQGVHAAPQWVEKLVVLCYFEFRAAPVRHVRAVGDAVKSCSVNLAGGQGILDGGGMVGDRAISTSCSQSHPALLHRGFMVGPTCTSLGSACPTRTACRYSALHVGPRCMFTFPSAGRNAAGHHYERKQRGLRTRRRGDLADIIVCTAIGYVQSFSRGKQGLVLFLWLKLKFSITSPSYQSLAACIEH